MVSAFHAVSTSNFKEEQDHREYSPSLLVYEYLTMVLRQDKWGWSCMECEKARTIQPYPLLSLPYLRLLPPALPTFAIPVPLSNPASRAPSVWATTYLRANREGISEGFDERKGRSLKERKGRYGAGVEVTPYTASVTATAPTIANKFNSCTFTLFLPVQPLLSSQSKSQLVNPSAQSIHLTKPNLQTSQPNNLSNTQPFSQAGSWNPTNRRLQIS